MPVPESGLASVILPVYNRALFVAQAIESVFAQTYRPIELIVVNDGSTDDTGEVCARLAKMSPFPVRVVTEENRGPGLARESGRRLARGEFIQYLDSDDLLDPRKIATQVAALMARPGAGIAYCMTREYVVGTDQGKDPARRTGEAFDRLFPVLLSGRCWHTITPLYRRWVTDAIGPWSDLIQEEDLEYDSRAASIGVELTWCPEFLADHRHHEGPRAGGSSLLDPSRMRARIESRRRVLARAEQAGVDPTDVHRRRYGRELFLLSRQCAAVGMVAEARELLDLARMASPRRGRTRIEIGGYRWSARLLGWERMGRLAESFDRFRSRGGPV